jgi:hypothetical protein
VSGDGGNSYQVLETFTGISGATGGERKYDISGFISADTRIRFRVTSYYGGYYEHFVLDYVQVEYTDDAGDAPTSSIVEARVDGTSNDAEERVSDGQMYLDSSDLELVNDSDYLGQQVVGIRFQNLAIPQGATITSAYIEFETDETDSVGTSLTFHGEASDNAATFGTGYYDISSRPSTAASVAWNSLPAWNTVGEKHQSPDLSAIVAEIVNRGGWTSGNSMVFIITGSGERTAEAWDGESSNAPLLHVAYSVP